MRPTDKAADIADDDDFLAAFEATTISEECWNHQAHVRMAWLYLRRYRSQLPVDSERLRYWEALNVFVWWSALEAAALGDPTAVGGKADISDRIRDGQLERMKDYFSRLSKPS